MEATSTSKMARLHAIVKASTSAAEEAILFAEASKLAARTAAQAAVVAILKAERDVDEHDAAVLTSAAATVRSPIGNKRKRLTAFYPRQWMHSIALYIAAVDPSLDVSVVRTELQEKFNVANYIVRKAKALPFFFNSFSFFQPDEFVFTETQIRTALAISYALRTNLDNVDAETLQYFTDTSGTNLLKKDYANKYCRFDVMSALTEFASHDERVAICMRDLLL